MSISLCFDETKTDSVQALASILKSLESHNKKTVKVVRPSQKSEFESEFERIYSVYPKKRGKTKGISKLKSIIKTTKQLNEFEIAMNNYISEIKSNRTEMKFIKNFDTFVNNYQDFLESISITNPLLQKGLEFGR